MFHSTYSMSTNFITSTISLWLCHIYRNNNIRGRALICALYQFAVRENESTPFWPIGSVRAHNVPRLEPNQRTQHDLYNPYLLLRRVETCGLRLDEKLSLLGRGLRGSGRGLLQGSRCGLLLSDRLLRLLRLRGDVHTCKVTCIRQDNVSTKTEDWKREMTFMSLLYEHFLLESNSNMQRTNHLGKAVAGKQLKIKVVIVICSAVIPVRF